MIFMSHTDLTNLTKAASQKARSLPTLPLFIEGVRRSREGVTSVARSVSAPHFVWNAPALWASTTPSCKALHSPLSARLAIEATL